MAYTSAAALCASIIQDVGRIANRIAKGVANIAFEDLQIAHGMIMDSYYAGFDPVQNYHYHWEDPDGTVFDGWSHGYNRTGNLMNSLNPIGVVPSGSHSFRATVGVSSSSMKDYVWITRKYRNGASFPASAVLEMVWDEGIRGLPPGHRGYAGPVNINASPVGVSISGKPSDAMEEFVNKWGDTRGKSVVDSVAGI